jgi:hypothetical protein
VHDFNLSRFSVAIMTTIQIGWFMLFWFGSAIVFYSLGCDSGYKEGRRAVREFYDKREKVRL